MEVFNDVVFVRLRSYVHRSKYLAAEVDGLNVCLTRKRGVHNTVWAVQHAAGPGGIPCVLLRGAYGRYLAAVDIQASVGPNGFLTRQAELGHNPPPHAFRWQAIRRRSSFVLRNGTGRYLRANGRYLRWRREITVALDNGSTMMQWVIENVPVRLTRPSILDPPRQLTHSRRPPPTEGQVTRVIGFVRAELDGSVTESAWRTMELRTSNCLQLRLTLANRMGPTRDVARTTLCFRAGRYGQLTPLVIDLPIGNERINLVVLRHNTPVDNQLRYPDLDAPAA
ncbi:hypothetical protein ACP70R_032136 [Stipagrostis hirtigluma subsp. patula]